MSQIDNGTAYPELTTPAGTDIVLGYRPAGADPMNRIISSKLNVNNVNGQSLQALATGLIKNTTSTGVPVIATPGTDYVVPSGLAPYAPLAGAIFTGAFEYAAEATVASATTADIGAATSNRVQITGTTTITGFGTGVNKTRLIRFAGALTLTYNATSLILPGAANITTAAGDTAIFSSDGSGNWRCITYQKFSGQSVVTTTVNTAQLCKAWVNFNGTGTVAIRDQYNVSSITDNGTGDYTVNFTSALPNANYAAVVGNRGNNSSSIRTAAIKLAGTYSTSAVTLFVTDQSAGVADTDIVTASIFSN